ncbi:MAG: 3-phosphoshikimate 1-carboxyvinyltransferase [Pseudomonadota bacterium]|jgi:3-phosphoshikimate 1-carboxyvinyltransferase|nr:3-phosphoshikimate 1-carboxyvinyltransferase [Burkholderiales bacterium]
MLDMSLAAVKLNPELEINLPGSKSIANRVLLLSAIATGTSYIHNIPLVAEDVQIMLDALAALGVKYTKINSSDNCSYAITGNGGVFAKSDLTIFCGNSGTSIRFLTAVLALSNSRNTLTGIERMLERPIKDLITPLIELGADIDYLNNEGYPPIKINRFCDNNIKEIFINSDVSSQYLTGLLMALPLINRQIKIYIKNKLISQPYIKITLEILKMYGCSITWQDNFFTYEPGSKLKAIEYTIEPDASSASYFLAIGAIRGKIKINNLAATSLQGDKDFVYVLEQMGAKINLYPNAIEVSNQNRLQGIKVNMEAMPDAAMTIAVLALFADGATTITGLSTWVYKETNRLVAMYNELTKLGADVTITKDSINIIPPLIIKSKVAIDTYNDHRMAMCFSLVAAYGIPIVIKDYQCVKKTFANYFDLFKQYFY